MGSALEKIDPNPDSDPDPGYFFKIYWIYKKKILNFFLIFLLIFMLKIDEAFRNQEIFMISLISIVHFAFESKSFFAVLSWYFVLDPDIQKARIRILNTDWHNGSQWLLYLMIQRVGWFDGFFDGWLSCYS